jgi:hypothetical protein
VSADLSNLSDSFSKRISSSQTSSSDIFAMMMVMCALALSAAPTIEIAPGVLMPYVSLGCGSGQKGDLVLLLLLLQQSFERCHGTILPAM